MNTKLFFLNTNNIRKTSARIAKKKTMMIQLNNNVLKRWPLLLTQWK